MTLQQSEQLFQQYTDAYKQQMISAQEYKSLIEGLQVEQAAAQGVNELQRKQQLHAAITAAITVVSALA